MSLVLKKIYMDLSPESIEKAIAQVNAIRDHLQPAMTQLVHYLAEKGVEIAKAHLIFFDDPAYYTGSLSESITYVQDEKGATVTAGEGLGSGADDGCSYAWFVEYGTGVFGADINGHGLAGWSYVNPNDGRWHHTIGMPARPFMHNTYEDLIAEAQTAGGKVLAEYLQSII